MRHSFGFCDIYVMLKILGTKKNLMSFSKGHMTSYKTKSVEIYVEKFGKCTVVQHLSAASVVGIVFLLTTDLTIGVFTTGLKVDWLKEIDLKFKLNQSAQSRERSQQD